MSDPIVLSSRSVHEGRIVKLSVEEVRLPNGNIETNTLQVRDVALAAAVLLTGQKPEDYGLVELHKNQAGMQFTYNNWRLPEDKRKDAFEKWKAWRAKNPDFGKPDHKK